MIEEDNMTRFDHENIDMTDIDMSAKANGTTILGWVIAPAMLLATLYISGMGPLVGSFVSDSGDMQSQSAQAAANVTQVFSVRYID
jgi:enamine deaminase RidA (YjgF/YER057c/UK114 family)